MAIEIKPFCDVLVIGSGIAGTNAARSAAKHGARVHLYSEGSIFSGSSFYPGTWGLGLVGPRDVQDEDNFIESICNIGQNVCDPKLVEHFVRQINSRVAKLEEEGLELKHPEPGKEDESAFIPCFDYKLRRWRGITQKAYKRFFFNELNKLGVLLNDYVGLVDICIRDKSLAGVLLFDKTRAQFVYQPCASLVLATGGFGSLFDRFLSSTEVGGVAQGIAAARGIELCNLEFMQIMPGIIHPVKGVVFNEKIFAHVSMSNPDTGQSILDEYLKMHKARNDQRCTLSPQEVLCARAGHGPFSAERISAWLDLCINDQPNSARMKYEGDLKNVPDFVQTYYSWLQAKCGIGLRDAVDVQLFAHAANGGIRINQKAQTCVQGIYAAGEVTGGMHGADRIGGLASANALVFGQIAGTEAAQYAEALRCIGDQPGSTEDKQLNDWMEQAKACMQGLHLIADPSYKLRELAQLLSSHCMVNRNAEGLNEVRSFIDDALGHSQILGDSGLNRLTTVDCGYVEIANSPADTPTDIFSARSIYAQARAYHKICCAAALVASCNARTESRGSHHRSDFPEHSNYCAGMQLLTGKRKDNGSLSLNSRFT